MEIAADPTLPAVFSKGEEPVPFLNFAPLQNAVSRLQMSAHRFDTASSTVTTAGAAHQVDADRALMHIEQSLLKSDGLPRRPWFRHQIYAPGFYTGYGVKTVPGVREAIEQKDWSEANRQIESAARVIDAYVAEAKKATETIELPREMRYRGVGRM